MSDSKHISTKDRLSQFTQISTLMYQILTVARAGGLAETEAEAIYHQIMKSYATMNGEAFWLFRDELIRILVTPDKHFDGGDTTDWTVHRNN